MNCNLEAASAANAISRIWRAVSKPTPMQSLSRVSAKALPLGRRSGIFPEPARENSLFSTRKPRTYGLRLIALAAILILCAAGFGCSSSDPEPINRRGPVGPMPVGVAPAQKTDMPVYLSGLGSVTAYYTVNVKSRIDGQLVQVKFKEGQHVNQGDLLAVIDPRPYQVALEQSEATLFKDQASLRDAKLNYQRYKGLLEDSGAMSQQQVDTQRATMDQFEGSVKTDQAAIDSAKLNLSYCHITAPVSGRVGLRLVDPGNMVHASDTNPMLVITQLQPISILFTLPEDSLAAVAQHLRKGTLEADAYSRDDQTKIATGKLLTISNQIDQSTGTIQLKALFSNKDEALWPNQFVNVHLLLEVRKNSIVIPSVAVQNGPQGNYVFVVGSDKKVIMQPVTVAVTQNNVSAIATGLSQNQMVVIDGQDKLQAGSPVEPRNGNAAGNRTADSAQSTPSGAQ